MLSIFSKVYVIMMTIASGRYYSICLPESREPQYPWFFMMFSYGSVSKPCTPVVHIKIAGIYGCSSH